MPPDDKKTAPGADQAIGLLAQAKSGDEGAFSDLMRLLYPKAYRVVFQILPSHEDVEEILQDSFLRLYKSLQKLRPEENPLPFLKVIAVRRTYSFLRWRKIGNVSLEDLPEDLPALSVEGTELGVADLYRWAQSLPAQRRLVFLLREVEGATTSEIASLMGVKETTVRRHASMAAEAFRGHFSR